MENIIEIKNLTKSYKMYKSKQAKLIEAIFPKINKHTEFKALNNMNLNVNKGEVLGILGKNGAGKSTLLKIITGVVVPNSGNIKINGRISSLLELGTAFNMELTGEENIYQHGQVMGMTKEEVENKKQEIIDFADIGDHLYQPVKTYSSGMFARLAFACAINVDPDILIVDEVLSVGDMAFQLKCFKKFEEFKKKGKTILFVTHNISDIIRNCTRTIILKEGEKIFDGNVKEGVELYKKIIVGIEETEEIKKSENDTLITYGNGKAQIIDYKIINSNNQEIKVFENDEEVTIRLKIKFNEDIKEPIFAVAIKDFKGLELISTNTMVEYKETGNYKKGEEAIVEFTQTIPLTPNKYAISFGCTKINEKGELEVYDRKYDAILIELMSKKAIGGIVEMKTKINISKEEENVR
ncbi:MAG: ABC transporter ATP-binding protein [Clostridia bacterium]|nr:ABC transporter ATP-binding protein [Clostridia bacterium]